MSTHSSTHVLAHMSMNMYTDMWEYQLPNVSSVHLMHENQQQACIRMLAAPDSSHPAVDMLWTCISTFVHLDMHLDTDKRLDMGQMYIWTSGPWSHALTFS